MLINCENFLRNERITNESEKNNVTRIATTTIMLILICLIKYCAIVIVSSLYN